MKRILELEEIEHLATGAWILGTGGGGNPHSGLLNMRQAYAEGVRIELVDISDVEDDASIATVASQGAPLVGQERLKDPAVIARSVRAIEEYLGQEFSHVMALEIGGGNAFYPLMAASATGHPVIDGDWMGRAYPELQMAGLCLGGLHPSPMSSVDPRGIEVVITEAPTWKWLEDVSRKICSAYGSTTSICLPPSSGRLAREHSVHRTISLAIDIGAAVANAQAHGDDPVEALLAKSRGRSLFRGKVSDVRRKPHEGFLRGELTLEGTSEFKSSELIIEFQNEWLLAHQETTTIAMSPDLICVIDEVSGHAIGTEAIRYGQRVCVIALPPPEIFLTEKGLELVGPRAFGYSQDFRSVFAK